MSSKQALKRVLIMAGGTGGHVFPGLALASYLHEHGVEVHWLGTSQGIESSLVPAANIPLHLVSIGGLRGKGIKTLLAAPFKVSSAVWQSLRIIQQVKPDIVVGMGGFVSGPGGVASWLMRCPLVIHEQNAKAGFTNKMLANLARRVLQGFPQAFKSGSKVVTVGNPVRDMMLGLPLPPERLTPARSPFRLLVLGGSLGAKALNEIVPQALAQLPEHERPVIWHQAGTKHIQEAKKLYESMGLQANVVPFIEDMGQAYAWADMVLCRAGALTVAELCAVGVGAILVPFPFAVDDHQTANASFMVNNQAAVCVQQAELTEGRLAAIVKKFMSAPQERLAMAQAAYALRQVKVTEAIFNILTEEAYR